VKERNGTLTILHISDCCDSSFKKLMALFNPTKKIHGESKQRNIADQRERDSHKGHRGGEKERENGAVVSQPRCRPVGSAANSMWNTRRVSNFLLCYYSVTLLVPYWSSSQQSPRTAVAGSV